MKKELLFSVSLISFFSCLGMQDNTSGSVRDLLTQFKAIKGTDSKDVAERKRLAYLIRLKFKEEKQKQGEIENIHSHNSPLAPTLNELMQDPVYRCWLDPNGKSYWS